MSNQVIELLSSKVGRTRSVTLWMNKEHFSVALTRTSVDYALIKIRVGIYSQPKPGTAFFKPEPISVT